MTAVAELVEQLRNHRAPNEYTYCSSCLVSHIFSEMPVAKQVIERSHLGWLPPPLPDFLAGCEGWEEIRSQYLADGHGEQLWEDALVWLALETR